MKILYPERDNNMELESYYKIPMNAWGKIDISHANKTKLRNIILELESKWFIEKNKNLSSLNMAELKLLTSDFKRIDEDINLNIKNNNEIKYDESLEYISHFLSKNEVIGLIGPPGNGKTYYAKNIKSQKFLHLDEISFKSKEKLMSLVKTRQTPIIMTGHFIYQDLVDIIFYLDTSNKVRTNQIKKRNKEGVDLWRIKFPEISGLYDRYIYEVCKIFSDYQIKKEE